MPSKRKPRAGKKKMNWGKILGISLASLSVLLVLVAFAAYVIANNFLRSNSFRSLVEVETSKFLGADVKFENFDWAESRLLSKSMRAHGRQDAAFTRLKASSLQTKVDSSSIWEAAWRIPLVEIERLDLLLSPSSPEERAPNLALVPAHDRTKQKSKAWPPRSVKIEELLVRQLNFDFLHEGNKLAMRGMTATMTPSSVDTEWKLQSQSGQAVLSTPRFADDAVIQFRNIRMRLGKESVFFDDVQADALGGSVSLYGKAELSPKIEVNTTCEFNRIDVEHLIPASWIRTFTGKADGKMDIELVPHQEKLAYHGDLVVNNAVLEGLPILAELDRITNTTKFRRLYFDDLTISLAKTDDEFKVKDLLANASGTACIKGHFLWQGDHIREGTYMLGVAPDAIKWMPAWQRIVIEQTFRLSLDQAFSQTFPNQPEINRPPGGFLWAVVRVDPSAAEPFSSDLKRQMIDAGGLALLAQLEGLPDEAVKQARVLAEFASKDGLLLTATMAEAGFETVDEMLQSDNIRDLTRKMVPGAVNSATGILNDGLETLKGFSPF